MPITPINLPSGRPPRFLVLADTPALGMKTMTTQVLRGLNRRFPEAKIGVMTSQSGAGFYQKSPFPLHIQKIPDEGPFCNKALHYVAPVIRAGQYDAVIALPFQEYYYYSLVCEEGIKFPFRIGSNKLLSALMPGVQSDIPEDERFTHHVDAPSSIVAPEEYMGKAMLRYLEPFGIYDQDPRPEAWSSSADRDAVDSRFRDSGILPDDFLLTLNLCAHQGHNQWRMGTLADVVRKINDRWGDHFLSNYGRLVFLVNYCAPDQALAFKRFQEALKTLSGVKAPVVGMPNNSPGELSRIISRSSYVITPETGTAHVAQALDVPATVVYQNNAVKRGWMLPGARVMPVVSRTNAVYDVPSEEVFLGSILPILEWCKK